MLNKKECKHKNLIKAGKHLYSDGYYQMHRCLDCGTTIKGDKMGNRETVQEKELKGVIPYEQ